LILLPEHEQTSRHQTNLWDFGLLMVCHLLIIPEVIPFDKVWAGRLKSVEEMRSTESFSFLIFMITIFVVKNRQLAQRIEN